MAKCIQNKSTGEITRVSNEQAEQLTKAGTHSYASKGDWRRQRKDRDDGSR